VKLHACNLATKLIALEIKSQMEIVNLLRRKDGYGYGYGLGLPRNKACFNERAVS